MWHWEEVDPSRSGSSGDISKLFKNEEIKEPGVFAADSLQADATLMAREVIQNSWDAARELHGSIDFDNEEPPEFQIHFEFRNLIGKDKERFVRNMGLSELRDHTQLGASRGELGLTASDCLDHLDDEDPLRVLVISETATTGMYGPWGATSKLYLALVSLGFTVKAEGAGGSYGYGKAGLIRGSAIRSLIAYTCFREQSSEPGVTRRLLGMTYWGPHSAAIAGGMYTGFARMGADAGDQGVVPFVDAEADLIADGFGLELRSAAQVEELGTTFVLVEPTVDPHDLRAAIERNWWPALFDGQFTAEITTPDGETLYPRPRKNEVLNTFIRSWEVATTPQDNAIKTEARRKFQKFEDRELGTLGLVADPEGWSYAQTDPNGNGHSVAQRSLVALVRGPRMVVEYLEAGQVAPFVRGTFVAHHDVDDLLRQTEPKAHDSWQSKETADGTDPLAPRVAEKVLSRIRATVNEFRKDLKPPVPRPDDLRLPVLEDLFKHLLDGSGPDPVAPDPKARDVAIRILEQSVEEAPGSSGLIRMRAKVAFRLADRVRAEHATVLLGVRFAFLEDGSAGERCRLDVDPPPGFMLVDDDQNLYQGSLGHEDQVFDAVSDPYDPDWSGRLSVSGELADGKADAA